RQRPAFHFSGERIALLDQQLPLMAAVEGRAEAAAPPNPLWAVGSAAPARPIEEIVGLPVAHAHRRLSSSMALAMKLSRSQTTTSLAAQQGQRPAAFSPRGISWSSVSSVGHGAP